MSKPKKSKNCPETCVIFVSYGRSDIAYKSYRSLVLALRPYRDRVKIIISDATNDESKMMWVKNSDADDVILTPRFTSAATSRNLAMTLIMDKYSPKYLCMVEDDFEYSTDWYPALVNAANNLYGVISPLDLAYGIFSTCEHHISKDLLMHDKENDVKAYMFGAVAYQRFVLTSHYLSVMRTWDSDVLGISFAQTGGQTFRNSMRGFCGAILPGNLSWPIDDDNAKSTWSKGKRDPGPPAHSFNIKEYSVICSTTKSNGTYCAK